ncbi:MAG TPA: hypothetical protein VIY48_07785, partial [Candidatus Paceibacterota bacterium]
YSYGLSSPDVQQTLADNYGYAVTPADNPDVFDSIIGKFGNNISDFPAVQTNSLTNIAQRQPAANVAVLTFESKYVDGDTGTLTPGGAFYVDQALKTDGKTFDTSRLEELGDLFERSYKSFSVVNNGMNLLAARVYDPFNRIHNQFSSIMSSPVDFVKEVIKHLLNVQTGNTLPTAANDNLGALYSFAAHNNRVKSALFLYTIARITRLYHPTISFFNLPTTTANQTDNTPLADALVTSVIGSLLTTVPQTQASNQFVVSKFFQINKLLSPLSQDTIRASLKSGTVLTRFVESMMQQVLSAFMTDDRAMIDKHTRFNGYLDTAIMMTVFDAILQMVARYNNQTIVSLHTGQTKFKQGVITFNVARSTSNHKASMNDLVTRLEKEVGLTHKLVYIVLNTLEKLSGALKNHVNYLKSPTALSKLRELSTFVSDPNMLNMLMSEQQIMLLASTVQDLVDRVTQQGLPYNGDIDKDGDFDVDDEIKVLDDSEVSPKLRNAVYGLFGSQEFAAKAGYNKKILTVGVPLGFTRRLKQRINIRNLKKSSFVDKQGDIVSIVVYKVDLQNSDIIYKPKRFLFEMSRFPVRNDNTFVSLGDHPTTDQIISSVPTRDYGESNGQNRDPHYWPTTPAGRAGRIAFDDTYSFLSLTEKNELIRNHVLSYLYEVYVKMMTGIS